MEKIVAVELVVEKEGFEATHLFDLEDDPYEMNNLLDDPNYVERQTHLYNVLQNWYRRVTSK